MNRWIIKLLLLAQVLLLPLHLQVHASDHDSAASEIECLSCVHLQADDNPASAATCAVSIASTAAIARRTDFISVTAHTRYNHPIRAPPAH